MSFVLPSYEGEIPFMLWVMVFCTDHPCLVENFVFKRILLPVSVLVIIAVALIIMRETREVVAIAGSLCASDHHQAPMGETQPALMAVQPGCVNRSGGEDSDRARF